VIGKSLRIGTAVVLSCMSLVACSSHQDEPTAPDAKALLQRIPPADPAKWNKQGASKNWPNPYLVVRVDGIGLLDPANSEVRLLKIDEVLDALAGLPPSAWPYGRVVEVQEPGLASEEQAIALRRNRGILGGTLEGAHITIVWLLS
jgi:hypothetical protein